MLEGTFCKREEMRVPNSNKINHSRSTRHRTVDDRGVLLRHSLCEDHWFETSWVGVPPKLANLQKKRSIVAEVRVERPNSIYLKEFEHS